MADSLRLAVGTLTCFRVPAPRQLAPRTVAVGMLLAPLAALLLLVPVAAVVLLARAGGLSPLIQAVLAVATLALGTRGLHLDGLADTCDGLAASHDRERALAVMRTGDVGPAGTAAVVLVLILQIACGTTLLATAEGTTLAAVGVVGSRLAITAVCLRDVPSARPEGLGALVAGSVPRWAALVAVALLALAGSLAGGLACAPWWAGAVVVLGCLVGGGVIVWRCCQRLGGITGDVLGATVEFAGAAGLLAAAAIT